MCRIVPPPNSDISVPLSSPSQSRHSASPGAKRCGGAVRRDLIILILLIAEVSLNKGRRRELGSAHILSPSFSLKKHTVESTFFVLVSVSKEFFSHFTSFSLYPSLSKTSKQVLSLIISSSFWSGSDSLHPSWEKSFFLLVS